jgi:hypothetical protein
MLADALLMTTSALQSLVQKALPDFALSSAFQDILEDTLEMAMSMDIFFPVFEILYVFWAWIIVKITLWTITIIVGRNRSPEVA